MAESLSSRIRKNLAEFGAQRDHSVRTSRYEVWRLDVVDGDPFWYFIGVRGGFRRSRKPQVGASRGIDPRDWLHNSDRLLQSKRAARQLREMGVTS